MPITIETPRFGELAVADEAVIEFPDGLIGLPGSRFTLVARTEDSSFLWLQAIDAPEIAVPVTDPWRFFARYEVELSDQEAARIGLTGDAQPDVYVTVRAAEELIGFRANLRAPILVSDNRGHQVVNEAAWAPLRAPLFPTEDAAAAA